MKDILKNFKKIVKDNMLTIIIVFSIAGSFLIICLFSKKTLTETYLKTSGNPSTTTKTQHSAITETDTTT